MRELWRSLWKDSTSSERAVDTLGGYKYYMPMYFLAYMLRECTMSRALVGGQYTVWFECSLNIYRNYLVAVPQVHRQVVASKL